MATKNIALEIYSFINQKEDEQHLSLYGGLGGEVLLGCIINELGLSADNDATQIKIDKITDQISFFSEENMYSFADGLSGISWLYYYLEKKNVIALDDNFFDDIDQVLVSAALKYLSFKNYDLLHGAGGVIFSLLMRPEKNRENLQLLTRHLLDARVNFMGSEVWGFKAEQGTNNVTEVNLGLAHGIPSVMVLLSKLYTKNILPDECLEAIKECYSFFQKNKNNNINPDDFSFYPLVSERNNPNIYSSRLAWCYGDLGIAMALYVTGKNIGSEQFILDGIQILEYYAQSTNEQKFRVRDSSFCHGAAGIFHIYSRMHYDTKNPNFKTAADYWLSELMAMSYHKDGIVGYKFFTDKWEVNSSLLEGVTGIGITLASNLLNENPDWDECLFIS